MAGCKNLSGQHRVKITQQGIILNRLSGGKINIQILKSEYTLGVEQRVLYSLVSGTGEFQRITENSEEQQQTVTRIL